ncbi:hypothetical protein HCN44_008023 [Aphidius gifuensis]|uniref:Uncharacterized protein n=1 Tax=Aphidius gifuensis TaxID=684658 RepID=A0A834XQ44_APHGI|nr:hypothetical protein HCN44_008023 [Aphidius gifuensis]
MSVISRIIGLRLVETTKYITKQNTTKFLQSMCQVRNRCIHTTKNPMTPAQKKSAVYWKKMTYSITLTVIGIYCAYKSETFRRIYESGEMWIIAEDESLKYSITPSKIITSGVLFDDGQIELFTEKDYLSLENDNTRNLILSEELDANIQEPFPRGEPVPVKFDKFNGLLDNGKLTLTTEDGDKTFTFHHTVSLEVKKTSTTLQDEIAAEKRNPSEIVHKKFGQFTYLLPRYYPVTLKTSTGAEYTWPDRPILYWRRFNIEISDTSKSYRTAFPINGNFSLSVEEPVKIQADDSDEVYLLKHNVHLECDEKVNKKPKNIIATKKRSLEKLQKRCTHKSVSQKDMSPGVTLVVFRSGTVVFKTQDGRKVIVRNVFYMIVAEDGQKTLLVTGIPRTKITDLRT